MDQLEDFGSPTDMTLLFKGVTLSAIATVFFNLIYFFRDSLTLPLFGSRTPALTILLLIFILSVFFFKSPGLTGWLIKYQPRKTLVFMTFISLSPLFFLVLSLLAGRGFEHHTLQMVAFSFSGWSLLLTIAFFSSAAVVCLLALTLYFIYFIQISVHIVDLFSPLYYEVTQPRNIWPYIGIIIWRLTLNYKISSPSLKWILPITLGLIVINQTKGAAILVFLLFTIDLVSHLNLNRRLFSLFIRGGALALLLLGTLVVPMVPSSFLGIEKDVYLINRLGDTGQYSDEFVSFISRSHSGPYTIGYLWDSMAIVGVGEKAATEIKFWGFPVHNYFISTIAIFGLPGLLFSLGFLYWLFRVGDSNLSLCLIGMFILFTGNDLWPCLLLVFFPFLDSGKLGWGFFDKSSSPRLSIGEGGSNRAVFTSTLPRPSTSRSLVQ